MRKRETIDAIGLVAAIVAVAGVIMSGGAQLANASAYGRNGNESANAEPVPARGLSGGRCGDAGELADFPYGKVTAVFGGDSRYLTDCSLDKAGFSSPAGIIRVGTSLYVANNRSDVISRIDTVTRQVSTFAGSAKERIRWYDKENGDVGMFAGLTDMTAVGDTIYALNISSIRKIDIATGMMTTLRLSGKDGRKKLNQPEAIISDGKYLYVAACFENAIYKIDRKTGEIVLRVGGTEGFADGAAGSARFKRPEALTFVDGSLYVADKYNGAIRKVDAGTGETTTLVGGAANFQIKQGFVDGSGWTYANGKGTPGTALFTWPAGIVNDGTYLYVADTANGAIRKVNIVTGATTTLAGGNGGTDSEGGKVVPVHADGSGWSNGVPGTARFRYPDRMFLDRDTLWVTEEGSFTIRKVNKNTGETTTYAGFNFKDGTGWTNENSGWSAGTARFGGVGAVGTEGLLGMTGIGPIIYVTDTMNNAIRKIDTATRTVTTLAGGALARDIYTGKAGFRDGTGWSYVNGVGKPGTALFSDPLGITTDGKFLFVVDANNAAIRKVDPRTGAVTTLAGGANRKDAPRGSSDGTGRSYSGASGTPGTALFNQPRGITTDGAFLYVTDNGDNVIRKIDITSGATSTLSGASNEEADMPYTEPGTVRGDFADGTGWSNGTPGTARFSYLKGITVAGDFLYVSDTLGNAIRKVNKRTGETVTFAGASQLNVEPSAVDEGTTPMNERKAEAGNQDGTGWSAVKGVWTAGTARFEGPDSLTTDGSYLYVADQYGKSIRRIDLKSGETVTSGTDSASIDLQRGNVAGIMIKDGDLWISDNRGVIVRAVFH